MFLLVESPPLFRVSHPTGPANKDCKPTGISLVIKHGSTIVYIISQTGFHKKASGVPRDKNA